MANPGPRVLRKGSFATQPQPSKEFLATLKRHLALFTAHYRQPLSEVSVLTYRVELSDLTPTELEAACREALRTSEFMPVVATIRKAHKSLQQSNEGEYMGPPMLSYPEISEEERDAALAEQAEFTAKLKAQLGKPSVPSPQTKAKNVQVPRLSLAEQKKILERRGFLVPGASHSAACLCPDCRMRREQTT